MVVVVVRMIVLWGECEYRCIKQLWARRFFFSGGGAGGCQGPAEPKNHNSTDGHLYRNMYEDGKIAYRLVRGGHPKCVRLAGIGQLCSASYYL